jgi:hypothetical protein
MTTPTPLTETLPSILVVGATGRLGKDICHALIANISQFTRLGFFNDTSRPATPSKTALFDSFRAAGMQEVSGLYTDPAPFKGFSAVILLLGNHALKYQPMIIDSAISAGVRHFYPSEFGADLSVGDNWNQRYYRDKVLTREHLEKRGADDDTPDLGWTYIQIGRFAEWSCIPHFGVNNITHRGEIYGSPSGRQSLLAVSKVLAFFIATLSDPIPLPGQPIGDTKGRRRAYRFQGSSPTWAEIFGVLEKVTGEKYEIRYHHVEEALKKEARGKEIGDVDMELEASHQLVQGREGTLLPEPWDNWRFPGVGELKGVEEALRGAFGNAELRPLLGLK